VRKITSYILGVRERSDNLIESDLVHSNLIDT
jgi:hypothetical protein